MVNHELNANSTDEEFEAYLENYLKEWEEFDATLDKCDTYMNLLEELYDLLVCTNNKISMLRKLMTSKIEEQYLIDLFLSETVAIFEGFNFSFLLIMQKYLDFLGFERTSNLDYFFKRCNVKLKRNKEVRDLDSFLCDSSKKTLNDPRLIYLLFTQIFKLEFQFPESIIVSKAMIERSIQVRNAHMHRNGIYNQAKFSFSEMRCLMNYYFNFIDKAGLAVNSMIQSKMPNI